MALITNGFYHISKFYPPIGQLPPQPLAPAIGQPAVAGQLLQLLDECATLAVNWENCFTGLAAPQWGHFLAMSPSVRAKWVNGCWQLEQIYS
jgi:hypothetical protein